MSDFSDALAVLEKVYETANEFRSSYLCFCAAPDDQTLSSVLLSFSVLEDAVMRASEEWYNEVAADSPEGQAVLLALTDAINPGKFIRKN